MTILNMYDLALEGQRVLIRVDLNVPVKDGVVTNDIRIRASLPSIEHALAAGAGVMLMSHLARPREGHNEPRYSLRPVAVRLGELLARNVPLVEDWLAGVAVDPGEVVLCENVRFNVGESTNDEALSRQMAGLCDVFVMDAFGTAHRAQASTHGVAKHAPVACAGPLLTGELEALAKALENPARPLLALVGGSKVSTKLMVLESLCDKVDQLIVGGGIANTFIAAAGNMVGRSLYEKDLIPNVHALTRDVSRRGGEIPVPSDVVVGDTFSEDATAMLRPVDLIGPSEMVLDIGPETTNRLTDLIGEAKTVVWNGPVGVFEYPQFSKGTEAIAKAIAGSNAFSIAGGGETLAAIDQFGVSEGISYISTGGGAFLEFLEGKTLPAVEVLEQRGAHPDG